LLICISYRYMSDSGQKLDIYLSPNLIKSMHIVCIQNKLGLWGYSSIFIISL